MLKCHTVFSYYRCDACRSYIYIGKLSCVKCIDDVYSAQIDLCLDCIDLPSKTDTYSHEPSHPMVKLNHFLHDGDVAWVVPNAQAVVERVKAVFRSMSNIISTDTNLDAQDMLNDSKTTVEEPLCCCCREAVTLPTWACVSCSESILCCLLRMIASPSLQVLMPISVWNASLATLLPWQKGLVRITNLTIS